MKIELEKPYKDDWKWGYLTINPENRTNLILYNSHKDRSTTQYSRYLMAVKLGRYLNANEHVDHIDEDVTNNSIDNLQILTPAENTRKSHLKIVNLICPICGKHFSKSSSQLRGRKYKIKDNLICCGKHCAGKMAHKTKMSNLNRMN